MNKKVDEEFKYIHDEYILQCTCTEMKDKINNLQSKIDKAIDKLESLLPMCIMPNNMLIHGTEKAKEIEETLDILKEDK